MRYAQLCRMPGHLIRRAHQITSSFFAVETKGSDFTSLQYAALVVIGETPGIEATGVATAIALDRATIGGVIDRLEAKTMIERRTSDTDRRVKRLFLTPTGSKAVARLEPGVQRAQDRLLSVLTAAERAIFLDLLARLVAGHEQRGLELSASSETRRTAPAVAAEGANRP